MICVIEEQKEKDWLVVVSKIVTVMAAFAIFISQANDALL